MALFSVKGPDIPKGQIPISRKDAVSFQLDLITNLAPSMYRNFITYGSEIACVLGFSSSLFITNFYRSSVKIGAVNKIYTSAPFTVIPALAHLFLHKRFVRDDIIIQKWACPYCYHMRSTLFQVFFGVGLPIVTSSVSSFAIARRMKKPGVPALNNIEIIKFFIQKTKPFSRILSGITIAQVLVGIALAQAEAMENNHFNQNIEVFIAEYERRQKSN